MNLTPKDKKVIDAFTDKKPAEGTKLTTDGKRLDGNWMGGSGIAEWSGGKIKFNDLGSKAAETVERAVRKVAPKNWLKAGSLDGWTFAKTAQGDATLNFKGLADMTGQVVQDANKIKQLAQKEDLAGLVNMLGILVADVAVMTNSTDPQVQATGRKLRKFVDEFGKHSTRIRKGK